MSKRFCFKMFCAFVCLAVLGFFLEQPVTTFFNIFMAALYLTKLIDA